MSWRTPANMAWLDGLRGIEREHLEELVGEGDLVLVMGAGDVWKLGDELANER